MSRSIVYVGNDPSFRDDLIAFSKKASADFEVRESASLIRGLDGQQPSLIFIDDLRNQKMIAEQVRIIRNYDRYKTVAIVALFTDKEEADEFTHLISSGVQLFYVKGGDQELLFKDSFYIAFDERLFPTAFATATEMAINLNVGVCSTITAASTDSIFIESDVTFTEDSMRVVAPPFYDHPNLPLKIKSRIGSPTHYPTLETTEFEYPFAGPWGDLTADTIPNETIEAWLCQDRDKFRESNYFIGIYTEKFTLAADVILEGPSEVMIELFENVQENIESYLDFKKPQLLIVELTEQKNIDYFQALVHAVKVSRCPPPVIIFFNSLSSSNALKVLFSYEKILSSSTELSTEALDSLIERSIQKITPTQTQTFCKFLRDNERSRALTFQSPAKLISLSEHYVTFVSLLEFPLFTNVEFFLPFPFLVLIIPSSTETIRSANKFQYLGIIHSIKEEDLNKLRRLVNQLIFNPVIELSEEIIEKMLYRKEANKRTDQLPEAVPSQQKQAPKEAEESGGGHALKRKHTNGFRSKL